MDSYLTLIEDTETLVAGAFGRAGSIAHSFFSDMGRDVAIAAEMLQHLTDEVIVNVNTGSIDVGIEKLNMLHAAAVSVDEDGVVLNSGYSGGESSVAGSGRSYSLPHSTMLNVPGTDILQLSGMGDTAALIQMLQQGTITVDMFRQAMSGASADGKGLHEVLGGIRDVSSGVKDGIDGVTKLLELSGKFSQAGEGANVIRSLKNFSGILDGGLKMASGAENVVGGISRVAGIGEVVESAALMEGAAVTAEAVTGFEMLTTATVGAMEGVGLLGSALLATPWGAAAAGIAAIGVGIYGLCKIQENNAAVDKYNQEVANVEKYNGIVGTTAEDLSYDSIIPLSNGSFFAHSQNRFQGSMFQEMLEVKMAAGDTEYRNLIMGNIKQLYSDLLKDKNTVSLVTLDKKADLDNDENAARYNALIAFFEKEQTKFLRKEWVTYTPEQPPKRPKAKTVSTSASNIVTGGGGRQIAIHVKSFAEHFTVNATNLPDAGKQSRDVFERMFLEVLHSANAAM